MRADLSAVCVTPSSSIRETIACIDRNRRGIALVIDDEGRLLDTMTDGDVRRAMLTGVGLETTVSELRGRRANSPYPEPVTAPVGTTRSSLLRLMRVRGLRQIPLLDKGGCVVGLVTLSDLVADTTLPVQAVIMAGGYGSRLRPLTRDLPKSMLPIGDQPLLGWILHQLCQGGIRDVTFMLHYKGDIIADYFGNGHGFGINIRYIRENQPMGTAGALGLLEVSDVPLLVINGDILTQVDFRAMLDFHQEYEAEMTVAVREHEVGVPYGVVETDNVRVTSISEKPVVTRFINAGIYLLNPVVCRRIPSGQAYDMPDLIKRVIADGRRVVAFPVREYWMDIGTLRSYGQAQHDARDWPGDTS